MSAHSQPHAAPEEDCSLRLEVFSAPPETLSEGNYALLSNEVWQACRSAAAGLSQQVRVELYSELDEQPISVDLARLRWGVDLLIRRAVALLGSEAGVIEVHASAVDDGLLLPVRARGAVTLRVRKSDGSSAAAADVISLGRGGRSEGLWRRAPSGRELSDFPASTQAVVGATRAERECTPRAAARRDYARWAASSSTGSDRRRLFQQDLPPHVRQRF